MLYAIAPWMIPTKPGRDQPAQIPLHVPVPPPGCHDRKPPQQRRPDDADDADDRYVVDIGGTRGDEPDAEDGAVIYQF